MCGGSWNGHNCCNQVVKHQKKHHTYSRLLYIFGGFSDILFCFKLSAPRLNLLARTVMDLKSAALVCVFSHNPICWRLASQWHHNWNSGLYLYVLRTQRKLKQDLSLRMWGALCSEMNQDVNLHLWKCWTLYIHLNLKLPPCNTNNTHGFSASLTQKKKK